MKKLLLIALMAPLLCLAEKPASATVGTNSVRLVASKPLSSINAFQNSQWYKQGTVVTSANRYYMACNDGTTAATGSPNHASGEALNGDIYWRFTRKEERSGVIITLLTDGAVNWSFSDYSAEVGKGLSTAGIGSGVKFGAEYQGAIHAISTTTNTVELGIQEWTE